VHLTHMFHEVNFT